MMSASGPDADFLQSLLLRPLLRVDAVSFCSARAFPTLTPQQIPFRGVGRWCIIGSCSYKPESDR
jgi:hypothetical protein